jgi:hypothetical protein
MNGLGREGSARLLVGCVVDPINGPFLPVIDPDAAKAAVAVIYHERLVSDRSRVTGHGGGSSALRDFLM